MPEAVETSYARHSRAIEENSTGMANSEYVPWRQVRIDKRSALAKDRKLPLLGQRRSESFPVYSD